MWQDELFARARAQHGVVAKAELYGLAPSRRAGQRELDRGRWRTIAPTVIVSTTAPITDEQRAMAAVLEAGPGSVVSHHSAAALWGLPGFDICPVHVSRERDTNGRTLTLGRRHSARSLHADQITTLTGLPVTRPERVPFDLANAGLPAARIERIVDNLWSRRLVTGETLRRVHHSLPRRGFRGTRLMRELLDARPDHWIPPASGLEGRVLDLLERNGCGGFERQVDLGGDDWIGRVDFVHRARKVVIEVQSERFHAALSSRRDDAVRFERLRSAGFSVVEVWEDEVWHRPADFLGTVTRLLRHEVQLVPPANP